MEKKSLGRGLEEIADIFISQKKENISCDDSTAEHISAGVGKSHCGHSSEGSEANKSFSEDNIITILNGRLKVTRSCLDDERSLENDLSEMDNDPLTMNMKNSPDNCQNAYEITEHVTRKKKIAYSRTPDVQQILVKSLCEYLGQNFNIEKIELVKVDELSRPGLKKVIAANILIYTKEEENY